jgi:hypothetical protein
MLAPSTGYSSPPGRRPAFDQNYDLTLATLAFALTANLAILVQLTLVTGASPSLTSFVGWTEFALWPPAFGSSLLNMMGSAASKCEGSNVVAVQAHNFHVLLNVPYRAA